MYTVLYTVYRHSVRLVMYGALESAAVLRRLKPRSHRARRAERVDASNQTNVKDRKHSHLPRRCARLDGVGVNGALEVVVVLLLLLLLL